MTLLIFYLLLAILVSFFCSIAEAVLLSVRPSYIKMLERRGASGAKSLQRLKNNLDQPLAAILTANTIAHTVGAAGVARVRPRHAPRRAAAGRTSTMFPLLPRRSRRCIIEGAANTNKGIGANRENMEPPSK